MFDLLSTIPSLLDLIPSLFYSIFSLFYSIPLLFLIPPVLHMNALLLYPMKQTEKIFPVLCCRLLCVWDCGWWEILTAKTLREGTQPLLFSYPTLLPVSSIP